MSQKVLIIGLDGGTWDILDRLIALGVMPTLKSLKNKGVSTVLTSTVPPITPTAWSSFQTGVQPDKHGVFGFVNFDKSTHQLCLANGNALRRRTLWDLASDASRQVSIINVPMTYPPRRINGAMITGMLTPDDQVQFTYPPELGDELRARFGRYQFMKGQDVWHLTKDVRQFTDTLIEIVRFRTKIALWLLEHYDWNLFMVHFQAVDAFQHPMWPYLDPQHPLFTSEKYMIAAEFYAALDEAIDQVSDTANAPIGIIMSDHGFQRRQRNVLLNNWLLKQGYLVPQRKSLTGQLAGMTFRAIRKLDKLNLRNRLLDRGAKVKFLDLEASLAVDWDQTQVYATGGAATQYALLYFPNGQPSQGMALAEKLIGDLCSLHDPQTSEPLIEWIRPAEALYKTSGPTVPDLVVKLKPGYTMLPRLSDELFTDVRPNRDYGVGTHHIDGIVLFWGDTIASDVQLPRASIVDIAPTVLYALDVPVPKDTDGMVLRNIFRPDVTGDREVIYQEVASRGEAIGAASYSRNEQRKVEDRLRNLGYLN